MRSLTPGDQVRLCVIPDLSGPLAQTRGVTLTVRGSKAAPDGQTVTLLEWADGECFSTLIPPADMMVVYPWQTVAAHCGGLIRLDICEDSGACLVRVSPALHFRSDHAPLPTNVDFGTAGDLFLDLEARLTPVGNAAVTRALRVYAQSQGWGVRLDFTDGQVEAVIRLPYLTRLGAEGTSVRGLAGDDALALARATRLALEVSGRLVTQQP